jgi:hypothetical protein
MSLFSKNPLLLAYAQQEAAGGISRSLRFNSSDSAYLSRTPASAGNRKTWTWAGWIKKSTPDQAIRLFGQDSYPNYTYIQFSSTNKFSWVAVSGAAVYGRQSIAVFRDFSAWMHVVIAQDTTAATASDRLKFYVNGSLISTELLEGAYDYPTQNFEGLVNTALAHNINYFPYIGASSAGTCYLADIYFIDGQALTPSSFTETDATTGQLIPKAYTGSYNVGSGAVNGFHLEFADNSAATATTLGKDTSGNSPANNWTPNNLSVTAGAGNDSVTDVPTNGTASTGGDPGGSTRGNYCTLNPLTNGGTLSNGNLDFTAGAAHCLAKSTFAIPTSGLWYAELTVGSSTNSSVGLGFGLGAASLATNAVAGSASNSWNFFGYSSIIINRNDGGNTYSGSFAAGDIIQIAVDPANNRAWAGQNNTWRDGSSGTTGNPSTGSNPTFTSLPAELFLVVNAYSNSGYLNCGQRPFAYSPPSGGYKALCTANLPAPLVTKPSTVMDVVLYTGTGSSLTLPYASSTPTSIAFTPDLVWIKGRSGATDHALYDAVRDVQKDLASNSTAAETTQSTGLTAFGTNTFTIGSLAKLNTSSATYAAWCWDAGSSTDTNNTAGSISSQVRANASAGFSIVTYTGTGANATVGHGLGVAPSMVIVKKRSATGGWVIGFTFSGFNWASDYFQFDTGAKRTDGAGTVFTTSPSSTVFSLGTESGVNGSSATFVAYCFAPVVGYSSFGSYTGNGSSDGPFVYTGFRPRYIMVKSSSVGGSSGYDWIIHDTARSTYNLSDTQLIANSSVSENQDSSGASTAGVGWDILSNGFKIRTSTAGRNQSGQTYIYCAWAESPFNYSRAR